MSEQKQQEEHKEESALLVENIMLTENMEKAKTIITKLTNNLGEAKKFSESVLELGEEAKKLDKKFTDDMSEAINFINDIMPQGTSGDEFIGECSFCGLKFKKEVLMKLHLKRCLKSNQNKRKMDEGGSSYPPPPICCKEQQMGRGRGPLNQRV
uniref:C2H2-type domain-containing protein n=1 Tax=Meloidogyne hapla TaxID=6305 RepID=A0A1I8B391_MELHA